MVDPRGGEPGGDASTADLRAGERSSVLLTRERRSSEGAIGAADGRSLRRDRNRDAVIQAMLQLVREGDLSPATADIADRAGVSHRSVFRYFDDLADLIREAFNIEFATAVDVATIDDIGQGSLAHRIERVVMTRIDVYDGMYNVSRAARYKAGSIVSLDQALVDVTKLARAQLRRQFGPELGQLPEPQADATLDALLVVTDFPSYDMMRRMLGYDHERIAHTWRAALTILLG
jgi:AcrR family transcriptional regulator